MGKNKKRQQAIESGTFHRNGREVTREQIERIVQPPKRMLRWRRGIVVAPVNKCSQCDETALAFVGGVFYCEKHLHEFTQQMQAEAENGKEDQAVHNADTSGGDELREKPGNAGDSSGSNEALQRNARRHT